MVNSLHDHRIEKLDSVSTIADGIAVKEPGDLTYDLCSKYVDDVVTVTDDEVSTAILALIEKQKMIAEGAGAVSLAAILFDKIDVKGKKVVALISGGNIDVTILSRVISRACLKKGAARNSPLSCPINPASWWRCPALWQIWGPMWWRSITTTPGKTTTLRRARCG